MATVFDVAQYILAKRGSMSAMKLQKLTYYAQAWSLVWDEKPLFPERIEAWANGPVVRDLYDTHRGHYLVNDKIIGKGSPGALSQEEMETIDAVLDAYGDHSAQWLSDQTHTEAPWRQARAGLPENERGSREITHDGLAEYYSSLN
ncbi:Panacea domain-containing protein [Cupriavidus necator]